MLDEYLKGGFGTWVAVWLAGPWTTLLIISSRIDPVTRSMLWWCMLAYTVIVLAVWGAIVKATSGTG